MDRSQPGTRLTGSPRAAYPNAPEVVQRLLGKTAVLPNGCYIWTGHVDPEGYARTRIEGRVTFVHRSVYATLVAPIPEQMKGALVEDAAFPRRMGRPEEYARLARAIVENPMLNGTTIRLDAGQRFRPK